MKIDIETCAERLRQMDNILILAHENPDGDAAGSAFALAGALKSIGKNVRVSLEEIPRFDEFMTVGLSFFSGKPDYIVAVDTADNNILGVKNSGITKDTEIDLCIDHHISNTLYATETYLDSAAAAASEALFDIFKFMNIELTYDIAKCLYVGISTDTGCFRFPNTTAKTLRAAAALADKGLNLGEINKEQFETKTREYAKLEKLAIGTMTSYDDGKIMMIVVTNDMFKKTGVRDGETQGLATLPREIEGVLIGITMKEKVPGKFRVSVRANAPGDAQLIASKLGGGGHRLASGCSVTGTRDDAVKQVLAAAEESLAELGLE